MKTMYPGMVNSPITELAADMTAGTDSITVLNGDALPIPPNLFVIGQGEFAETVLFTVKSGNTISGLTRGLQGVARAWPSGAKLSRNFTEYDYRALIDNVNEAFNTLAPLDSPEFTDIPTAPTAAPMTNTKQIANTEFVTEAVLSLDASITSLDDEVISVKESVQDVSSQLAETEQQIDQLETTKANESDVNEKFNLKRDKNVKINNSDLDISSDANKVKLINLSDEVHAAMAGTAPVNPVIPNVSITREKSAPLSYTRNMTGFYENASSNLYDKTYNTPGYFDYLTGAFIASAGHQTTDYIPVFASEKYIQRKKTFITFYDINKVFVSGVYETAWTIPTGLGIVTMRCTVIVDNIEDNIINRGSTLLPFESYKVTDKSLVIENHNLSDDLLITSKHIDELMPNKVTAFERKSLNLFNKSMVSNGFCDLNTGIQNNNISYRTSEFIPALGSTTYTHNGLEKAFKTFYDTSKVFISGINTAPPFTTPDNTAFMKVCVAVPELGDLQTQVDTAMIVLGTSLPSEYKPFDFYRLDDKVMDMSQFNKSSKWYNKKWNALGDSITFGYRTTKTYWQYINDEKNFGLIRNYGISGSRIAYKLGRNDEMSTRYVDMDDDADLITAFGGTNDFNAAVSLGVIADTQNITFYGALNVLCAGLINKYPDKPIAFFTPLHRGGTPIEGLNENTVNSAGHKLVDYVNAIKEVCEIYSIPVFDLWSNGGLQPNIQAQHNLYFPLDGLHPNAAGHEIMSKKISAFIETF